MKFNDQNVFGNFKSKRRFNFIFFVSSSKTYSFSISIPLFATICTLLGAVLLWSMFSAFWISSSKFQQTRLTSELKLVKTKLFEYQSRYDDVYSGVYNSKKIETTSISDTEKSDPKNESSSTELRTSENKPEKTNLSASAIDQDRGIQIQGNASDQFVFSEIGSSSLPVKVKDVAIEHKNKKLGLEFKMHNLTRVEQSGGVRIALFYRNKGDSEERWFAPITGVELDASGMLKGASEGFRIRNFNQKNITFNLPAYVEKVHKIEMQLFSSTCLEQWRGFCRRERDTKIYRILMKDEAKISLGESEKVSL